MFWCNLAVGVTKFNREGRGKTDELEIALLTGDRSLGGVQTQPFGAWCEIPSSVHISGQQSYFCG